MTYGFSFSKKQCDWLGLDWQETLTSLCSSEKLKIVRLSIYWDEVEKESGIYDFSQIKQEIELATNLDMEIIVTIGMKAQRWPEFYIPGHIKSEIKFKNDVSKNKLLRSSVIEFIESGINELKDYKNIIAWQVENEPIDPQWPEKTYIGLDFLQEEIDLVKSLDQREIQINAWGNNLGSRDSIKKLSKLKNVKTLSFDYYTKQHNSKIDNYQGPDLDTEEIISRMNKLKKLGFNIGIAELQAEPWENFDYKENPERIKSISIELIKENIKEFSKIDPEFILLWGAEYWVWSGTKKEVLNII